MLVFFRFQLMTLKQLDRLLLSIVCKCNNCSSTAVLTNTTSDGSFTGFLNDTSGIIHFHGVRFADAPIGNLRWRAPVSPPSTHLGNVDAKKFANACIPTTIEAKGTSEDCLFGNVTICYFARYLLVLERHLTCTRYSFL